VGNPLHGGGSGTRSPWCEGTSFPLPANNLSAIALTKDNILHSRTKHIDIQYHYVRDAVEEGVLWFDYVPMEANIADIFTKALALPKIETFTRTIGLFRLPAD